MTETKYKVECYIKLKKDQLYGVYCCAMNDGRLIWRYPNRNIVLSLVDYKFEYTDPNRNILYQLKSLDPVLTFTGIESVASHPLGYNQALRLVPSSFVKQKKPQSINESYQSNIHRQTSQIVYSSSGRRLSSKRQPSSLTECRRRSCSECWRCSACSAETERCGS